jgi:hypothetical protein
MKNVIITILIKYDGECEMYDVQQNVKQNIVEIEYKMEMNNVIIEIKIEYDGECEIYDVLQNVEYHFVETE